jgi:hypothetical protein
MGEQVEAALDYAVIYGWRVIPLHSAENGGCSCREGSDCGSPGKHPRVSGWTERASTDPEEIAGWWRRWPEANVGVVTGAASGIVALDVDPEHGGAATLRRYGSLPETAQSLTGGGGWHYLFRHPDGEVPNSAGELGPGLDIRGDGGFVVAPPSVHASGRMYRWIHPPGRQPLLDPPRWVHELTSGSRRGAAPEVGEMIEQDARNVTLASLAGSMRRRGMAEEELLQEHLRKRTERDHERGHDKKWWQVWR